MNHISHNSLYIFLGFILIVPTAFFVYFHNNDYVKDITYAEFCDALSRNSLSTCFSGIPIICEKYDSREPVYFALFQAIQKSETTKFFHDNEFIPINKENYSHKFQTISQFLKQSSIQIDQLKVKQLFIKYVGDPPNNIVFVLTIADGDKTQLLIIIITT